MVDWPDTAQEFHCKKLQDWFKYTPEEYKKLYPETSETKGNKNDKS